MIPAGIFGSARVAAAGGITATFQQSGFSASDLTTYTFAAVPIGSASATRRAVVALGWAASADRTVSSVTIGGVSATVDVASGPAGGSRSLVMCSAVVPTGTTADVVLTLSGSATRAGYALATLTSGSPTGQSDTDVGNTSGTLSVTTSTGDVVIGAVLGTNGTDTTTITLTGLDTEWYNESFADGASQFYRHAGGAVVATGGTTAINFSVANSGSRGAVAAAYA